MSEPVSSTTTSNNSNNTATTTTTLTIATYLKQSLPLDLLPPFTAPVQTPLLQGHILRYARKGRLILDLRDLVPPRLV
jgi:hypothetical protein